MREAQKILDANRAQDFEWLFQSEAEREDISGLTTLSKKCS